MSVLLTKKAIVVVGPTASGKTALGVYIAKKFNGEVISADSMQIYKGMSISTAKPSPDETEGIPHHLIDFVPITEKYSVSDYCADAKTVFDDITSRGKLPVIVGGTGLYVDSFLTNTKFIDTAFSEEIRQQLQAECDEKGLAEMYRQLQAIDPEACDKIHPNNKVRVLRALEVYRASGKTITEQTSLSRVEGSDIEPLYIGITYKDRDKLYDRINRRVDIMIENGLIAEAKDVFSKDYSVTAFNSIGCKEIKPYLDGEKSLEECLETLKQSTRHYAKRQLTWFRRNDKINWLFTDTKTQKEFYSDIDNMINNYLKEEGYEG